MDYVISFLVNWAITAASLWVASKIFRGLKFDNGRALVISALLLGFANAIVRPLLVVLTLPLTILTLGVFLLVINALVLMLVAALVRGFRISGFWTAFFASIFISVLAIVIGAFVPAPPDQQMQLPTDKGAVWL
jgi:putative membrane protein